MLVNCEREKFWGMQMLVDCAKGNENVSKEEAIQLFVDDLVKEIEMEKQGEIKIERFGEGDLVGITFCQFIKTSSIVGHFCDVSKNFYLDVFSCKKFNPSKVLEIIRKHFDPDIAKHSTVERGI